jgi:hypothetical protein
MPLVEEGNEFPSHFVNTPDEVFDRRKGRGAAYVYFLSVEGFLEGVVEMEAAELLDSINQYKKLNKVDFNLTDLELAVRFPKKKLRKRNYSENF